MTTTTHAHHAHTTVHSHTDKTPIATDTAKLTIQEAQEDRVSFFVLCVVTFVFLVILFGGGAIQTILSKFSSGTTQQSSSGIIPALLSQEKNCHKYDGDLTQCVAVQQQGRGCEWHASCNVCINKGESEEDRCKSKVK